MFRAWAALALLLGCTDGSREPTPFDISDDHATIRTELALPYDAYNICERLPDSGPCSLLCDRDALIDQYVPPHTCAVFVCELDDGERITIHACHPPD